MDKIEGKIKFQNEELKIEFAYSISEDMEFIEPCFRVYVNNKLRIDDDGIYGFKNNNGFFYQYTKANFKGDIAYALNSIMGYLENKYLKEV